MMRNRQIQLKTVSLGLVCLLAAIWGLRWHHAHHGHEEGHHHHFNSDSHDSDDPKKHDHDDCELCKWALAFFEVEEPCSWKWAVQAAFAEPVFFYINPGVEQVVTANCLRGPPVAA